MRPILLPGTGAVDLPQEGLHLPDGEHEVRVPGLEHRGHNDQLTGEAFDRCILLGAHAHTASLCVSMEQAT